MVTDFSIQLSGFQLLLCFPIFHRHRSTVESEMRNINREKFEQN